MSKKIRFVDCGANVGKAVDWAKNKYKEDLIKIDAFEPEYFNYTSLLEKYAVEDSLVPVVVHTQAVWVEDIIKNFYIQARGTRTGSSLLKSKEQAIKTGQYIPEYYRGVRLNFLGNKHFDQGQASGYMALTDCTLKVPSLSFPVQCIDLSDWIIKNLSKDDHNIIKIDIEGAEYKVIEHLLETEAHDYIDEWLVEFTSEKKAPEDFNQEVINKFKSTVKKYVDWSHF